MRELRVRLTYANAMATIAVFIALGGTGYAAFKLPKNSVGAKQIKKNAVTTAKIKDQAVTAAKIQNGALTGAQINSATLATVPTANMAETAQTAQTANALNAPEPWHVVGAPGEPQFQHSCKAADRPGTPLPRFFKDHDGVVHMEGLYGGCSGLTSTAFILPAGYRPAALMQFLTLGEGAVAGVDGFEVGVKVSGEVYCAADICFLNGITFRAES